MPKLAITTEEIRTSLQAKFGDEITTANITEWCEDNDYNVQTISNRLKEYKYARGKFNLSGAQAEDYCT